MTDQSASSAEYKQEHKTNRRDTPRTSMVEGRDFVILMERVSKPELELETAIGWKQPIVERLRVTGQPTPLWLVDGRC